VEYRKFGQKSLLGPVNGYQANAGGSLITMRDFHLSYRPSTHDVRHVMHASGTYDLPFGKGRRFLNTSKLADGLLGGWTLGTIVVAQSGPPVQVSGGYATFENTTDGGVIFAQGVTAKTIQNAIGIHRTGNPWVQTVDPRLIAANGGVVAANAYTPNITPGMIGANPYVHGPHWFNADFSINKYVPIRESIRGNLQAQFLNVFNHPAFSLGGLGAQSLTYGQSTGLITGARRIEIRANIEF
jgi:hypothetical protein